MTARRRMVVTAGMLLGMFLAALEVTIVGTAMPTVVASLGGLSHYSWVFSAYIITSTVPVPVWGKLSDVYGRLRLYQIGTALFLLGSMLSGISTSMGQLIAFRALQGLGAGILMPLTVTIIGDIYTLEERTRMQAVFASVWGLSSLVGPLVGGFITDHLNWRWVFFINLPFGLISALVLGYAFKEPLRTSKPKVDYAGAFLLIVAVTLLMLAVSANGEGAVGAALLQPRNLLLLLGSAVVLALFVRVETRVPDPIMPPALLKNRAVSVALLAGFFAGIGLMGAISFVPFFAQGVLGMSATQAGSLLTPLMLAWVTAGALGGRLLLRVGFRNMAQLGALFMTAGLAYLGTAGRGTVVWQLTAALIVLGIGLGLVVLTLLLAGQTSVPRTQLGLVTSLTQFARSMGGALGVAIMGVVLSASLGSGLMARATEKGPLTPALARELVANPNALVDAGERSHIPAGALSALQDSLAGALGHSFFMAAGFAFLAFLLLFALPNSIGQPSEKSCSVETGERLLMAEMTTLDPDHEPSGV